MEWLKRNIGKCLVVLIVGILIAILLALVFSPGRIIDVAKADIEVLRDERTDLDRIVDVLAICESRNNPDALNPHDPITPSYGLLQWKTASFYEYNRKYRLIADIEPQEVINVIYDPVMQREMAGLVIRDGGWRNWTNCLKPYFD